MLYRLKYKMILALLLSVVLLHISCKKKDVYKEIDYNTINPIIQDNYNLSVFGTALKLTGLDQELQESEGPYTAIVPSDEAFARAGMESATVLKTRSTKWIANMVNYHILRGRYELQKFPYLINQEVRSRGGKVFISHWIKGQDTILTINGARVLWQDFPASNGRVQVVNRVLEPYIHDFLADAVTADTTTLFAEALRRSGLMETLRGTGPYTLFAPSNAAMRKAGFKNIHEVKAADPEILRELCSYHIALDQRFVYDYIIAAGHNAEGEQRMLNTYSVKIKLVPDESDPSGYGNIVLSTAGNLREIELTRWDMLAGNGVMHIIDEVLRINR